MAEQPPIDARPARPWAAFRPSAALAWIAALVALALVAAVTIRITAPREHEDALTHLVPLAVGTTWVYDTTSNGKPSGQHVVQVTGPALLVLHGTTVDGLVVRSHFADFLGQGQPFDELEYEVRLADSIVLLGRRSGGSFKADDPPQPLYVLPLTKGQRWTWNGTEGTDKQSTENEILGTTTATVFGQRVAGCVRSRSVSRFTSNDKPVVNTLDEVTCPDIGIVSVHESAPALNIVLDQQLAAFHSPESSVRAGGATTAGSSPTAVPGSTPGVDMARTSDVPGATLDTSAVAWTEFRNKSIDFPPVGEPGLSVLAESDGTVTARDPDTGEILWRLRLAQTIVAPPTVVGGLVFVADGSKALFALDAKSGVALWTAHLPDVVSTSPVVADGTVVVPVDDFTVQGLRLSDGRELWSAQTQDLVKAPPALGGDAAIVADQAGNVDAFSLRDGSTEWQQQVSGTALWSAGPVVAGGVAYVASDAIAGGGAIDAFDVRTGALRWTRFIGSPTEVPLAAAGGRLVSIPGEHRVRAMDAGSGARLWQTPFSGTASSGPIVIGSEVAVLLSNGRLDVFSLATGALERQVAVHAPRPGVSVSTGIPMSYEDGALVVPATFGLPWTQPSQELVAYPVSSGSAAGTTGVSFDVGRFAVSPPVTVSGPYAVPVRSGGDVVFPAYDGKLWAQPEGGSRPSPLFSSTANSPFVVTAPGGLLLTQDGEDLVALKASGGPPLWRFHMGAAAFFQRPVVTGDRVVVPVNGVGLAGLDLATGNQLWSLPQAGKLGTSSPLLLADGDVANGGGGLVAVDPATGRVRWSDPNVVSLYSSMAEDSGVLVVQGADTSAGQYAVMGVDERTGAELWSVPTALPALSGVYTGPAAADGVAVASSPGGAITAYDIRTGRPVWATQLLNPPSGPLVAVGDRLALLQQGRIEDLDQRDYELRILDIRTGRWEGSLEPPGTPSFAPAFGADEGSLFLFGAGVLFEIRLGTA